MRFGDTDALGHVNNASFASYAEVARLEFLQLLEKSVTSLILASLHIDYRRQVGFGSRIYVETWVAKLGNTSMTLGQAINANDELAADVRSVVVLFDYSASKPLQLTSEMRMQLEPYVARERTPGGFGLG